jgi:hypothetical protein
MKVFRAASVPLQPADPNTFSGIAHVKHLAEDDRGVPVGVPRRVQRRSAHQLAQAFRSPVAVRRRTSARAAMGEPVEDVVAGDAVADRARREALARRGAPARLERTSR